jgi:hypothetical protein
MYLGKTLFAQAMDFLPWKTFHRIVKRYGGDHRTRSLSCAEQFRVMAFAQLTYRESLRDIEVCLEAQAGKLYHMGIGAAVARSTLADATSRATGVSTSSWLNGDDALKVLLEARNDHIASLEGPNDTNQKTEPQKDFSAVSRALTRYAASVGADRFDPGTFPGKTGLVAGENCNLAK